MKHARFIVLLMLALVTLLALAAPAAGLPEIGADKFQPSQACGCHAGLLEDWSKSMHAKALEDPIYKLKLDEAKKATDGALGPFCEACHGPVAVMSGEIANLDSASAQSKEGVVCDFCHQVTGTGEPLANTSQIITADGTKRAQFSDAVSPVHKTEYSQFHETAEFCGACHNVDHPGNGMHLEATYTEWKNGPYAEEGIVCQDCHMTPGPGVTKPYPGVAAAGGPQRDHVYLMTFAGGNVGLGDAELAEQRLQAAAEVALEIPEIVAAGSSADAKVTITNIGAGHFLPTGLTEVRQMWLEVVATQPDGTEEVLGRHEFGSVLEDASGKSPVELWEAVAFAKDDRIPPKESVSDTFEFTMPAAGEAEVKATLYYRSCSEEMAEEAGVVIPTTTMAQAVQPVFASEEIRSDARAGKSGEAGGGSALIWAIGGLLLAGGAIVFFVLMARRKA